MIGKNTEKAIKAWLALPVEDRGAIIPAGTGRVELYQINETGRSTLLARFSIRSIVAKRYPRRKKVKR